MDYQVVKWEAEGKPWMVAAYTGNTFCLPQSSIIITIS